VSTVQSAAQLAGRRVFLTGGAHGIGAAIARRLAADGAQVLIADLDLSSANQLAAEIGASAVELDVTELDRVAQVIGKHEPFDTLINNAGVDQHAFFTKTSAADWRMLLAVNLEAVFATTRLGGRTPGLTRRCGLCRCQGRRHCVYPFNCPRERPQGDHRQCHCARTD
jgi:NAD(P)-dependent dehydrogenase (short-subunit alcohol dehydrogenase family)